MIRYSAASIALVLAMLITIPCSASPIGFTGAYSYASWSSSNTLGEPTSSSIDGSDQILTLYEPNSGGGPQSFDFSHAAVSSGIVSFDWSFNWDIDDCCSGFNFYVNFTLYHLADGYPDDPYYDATGDGSGTFSVAVNAGDILTFGAYSADGCCGAATSTISNFNGPASVSEPASLAIFGVGLLGIAIILRNRAATRK